MTLLRLPKATKCQTEAWKEEPIETKPPIHKNQSIKVVQIMNEMTCGLIATIFGTKMMILPQKLHISVKYGKWKRWLLHNK